MANPLKNAQRRLAELRAEIARIERFIEDYNKFSGGTYEEENGSSAGGRSKDLDQKIPVEGANQFVDNRTRRGRKRTGRPDEIAQIIQRVIREVGMPMTRSQIVEALERREVDIPALDKQRYVGTLVWRHKSWFVNIEGHGYWLRGQPIPGLTQSMTDLLAVRVPGDAPWDDFGAPSEVNSDDPPEI